MNALRQNATRNRLFVYKNDLVENKIYKVILAMFLVHFVIFVDFEDY